MAEPGKHTHCQNCGRPLEGGFCSQCGQSAKDYDVPASVFAKEFASETLSLDSRLRLTLQQLVLRPGAVPKDFVQGHRARHVPPVRLYVFASFAMFLMLSFRPGVVDINAPDGDAPAGAVEQAPAGAGEAAPAEAGEAAPAEDGEEGAPAGTAEGAPSAGGEEGAPAGTAEGAQAEAAPGAPAGATTDPDASASTWRQRLTDRFFEALRRASSDSERFGELFLSRLGGAMFFLLPAFAALLKVVYRRRLYVHHLVFSIYLHSFVFLLLALGAIPSALGMETVAAVTDLSILWIPVYLFLGMRRFYGESLVRTLMKFAVVSGVYWILGTMTVGALLLFSLMTY